jgi:hypothetical protein
MSSSGIGIGDRVSSRKRKKNKEEETHKTVDEVETEDGYEIANHEHLGKRAQVYWTKMKKFYVGRICAFCPKYDDVSVNYSIFSI